MTSLLRRWLLLLLCPTAAFALGPHELLLLVNANSPRSIEIANHYAHLRGVPPSNIVHLDLPASASSPTAQLSREEFTRTIWEPVQTILRDRRIGDHILAWAYAADFPVLITGDPELSLTGLTLVRNQLPEAELIRKGAYQSRLFAGPGHDLQKRGPPRSLEQYAMALGTNMPVFSMMLAHTGSRGETVEQALQRLTAGTQLNGNPLSGGVYFLTSDDVRSTCRSWQFEDAAAELGKLGLKARVMPLTEATRTPPAWGLMAGISLLDPTALPQLVPGSVAEHLTSFGALFYGHDYQTKVTAWLHAGAASSAGTVTEPYALWTKFPHARLFVHYASGCTLLEAYAQSVASPMQLICLGDPLLAPWAKRPGLTLVSLAEGDGPLRGTVEFAASTWAGPQDRDTHIMYLLDGRTVLPSGTPPLLRVPTTQLSDGYHELRAVAYAAGNIRHQGFTTLGFTVANRERRITVEGLASNAVLPANQPVALTLQADPRPKTFALLHHEILLDQQPAQTGTTFRLDPALLGPGPHRVQIAAVYDDGEIVRSAPIPIRIEAAPRQSLAGDRVPLAFTHEAVADGAMTMKGDQIRLRGNPRTLVIPSSTSLDSMVEVAVTMTVPGGERALASQHAGLVFAYEDEANYCVLSWNGANGSWGLRKMTQGVWSILAEWGATLARDQASHLRLTKQADGGMEAYVDSLMIGRLPATAWTGRFGLAAGVDEILFQASTAVVAPPAAVKP